MMSARSLRWAPALLALVLLGSCDDTISPSTDDGVLVGRWAGGVWVGDARAAITSTSEGPILSIFGSRPQGGLYSDEMLTAQVRFNGPGLYFLAPTDVWLAELIGGDVVSAEYHGTGSPAGTLRITAVDHAAGVVVGELEFRATTQSGNGSYGTTARFEDGAFRATMLPTLHGSP